ncbi:hypothetical protein QZQ97_16095 [Serratia sp. root2]|uniref:MrpH family fimbial adhesin n=1 Tax=Serratia sp. root2 TaxID=3059676 RepID=UPI00288FCADE|nr:hypothetical protein [Serratia sp. root2]MDT3252436.1 hypothetical protein [Serratia sp. root2]
MKIFSLILATLFGYATGANAVFHEASVQQLEPAGGSFYKYSITAISVSSLAPFPNQCYYSASTYLDCDISISLQRIYANGTAVGSNAYVFAPLARRLNGLGSCYPAGGPDCKSINEAKTIGELVPLMKLSGVFGKTATGNVHIGNNIIGVRSCIRTYVQSSVSGGVSFDDCGPTLPVKTTCSIADSNAIIDFGSFSNDVVTRKASGSFRVNCSGEAYMRVKFASSVTDMSLSQDGKLRASLKVRNSIPGLTDLESFIKVPGGSQEIVIDSELKNSGSSHTGPFFASAVAIVEIA